MPVTLESCQAVKMRKRRNCVIAQGRGKDSEGTRIAASPFAVMDTYSALWLINAIIVLRLEFRIPC